MHPQPSALTASDAKTGPASAEPAMVPCQPIASDDPDFGSEATLRLLRTCVEALSLMQAKVDDLEAQIRDRLDAGARDADTLRTSVSTVDTALMTGTARVTDVENRMARLEVSVQEFASRHADDVGVARTEAANWRMRVETDAMGFEQLTGRIVALEEGLAAKLDQATQTIADRETDNVRLQAETRIVESASERLRGRLISLDATIADQRARISCLQTKLATATYAIRFEHMSRTMEAAGEHDILDLAAMAGEGLVSAA